MEVTGTIVKVFNEQQVSEKFKKRELVIQTNDQYPQEILVQFVQDSCSLLDNVAEGENVTVRINLRGRSWTSPQGETKWFNTIQGWKIDVEDYSVPETNVGGIESNFKEDFVNDLTSDLEEDGLPF